MSENRKSPEDNEARWAAYMRASQAGESEAFETLLREILPHVRSHVFGRLPGREYGEDVVQNVLLAIHRSRHTYQPSRAFKPWLNAVTRNAIIDALRARRNDWRYQTFEEFDSPVAAPPRPGEFEEISEEFENALSKLPYAQREAVELLHMQELSLSEASEKTGSSVGALKVRVHRGRARLRELLAGRKP